jgi:hypothetical protein
MALFAMSGVLRGFAPAAYTFETRGKFVFHIAYHLWPIAYDQAYSPQKILSYELETYPVPTLVTLFMDRH